MGKSPQLRGREVGEIWVDEYLQNPEGTDWYHVASLKIRDKWGDKSDLYCDLLAATSPQTTVTQNVKLANAAMQWKLEGRDEQGFRPWIPSHGPNVLRSWRGQALSGPKVRAFSAALRGDLDAVVVDTWMLRAAGYTGKAVKHRRSFEVAYHAILDASFTTGLRPTQAQAAVWMAYRKQNWNSRSGIGDGYLPV